MRTTTNIPEPSVRPGDHAEDPLGINQMIDRATERVRQHESVRLAFGNATMRAALDAGMGLELSGRIGGDYANCIESDDTDRGLSAALLIRTILKVALS
jgi:hypothetical protein